MEIQSHSGWVAQMKAPVVFGGDFAEAMVKPRKPMDSTRRNFLTSASALLIGSSSIAFASEPWVDKNPTEWSGDDIQTVLNHSPWVRDVTLEMDPTATNPDKGKANHKRQSSGLQTVFKVVVRWESGLPLRLARRTASLPDKGLRQYLLSISGLPLAFIVDSSGHGPAVHGQDDDLAKSLVAALIVKSTSLQRETKGPIAAYQTDWVSADFSSSIVIAFLPGDQPIQLKDQEVIFVSRIGSLILRARFSLNPMVYRGKLEL